MPRGIGTEQDPFSLDLCFGEIFDHARKFVFEAFDLLKAIAGGTCEFPCPRTELPKASEAWIATQVMLGVVIALEAYAFKLHAEETGTPTKDVDSYFEYMNYPAAMSFHCLFTGLGVLEPRKSEEERNTARAEMIALTVSVCVEQAKQKLPHW